MQDFFCVLTLTFPYLQFNSPVNKFSFVIHLYSVLDCQEGWTVQELASPWPRWAVSTLIPPGTILIRAEDPTLSSNCSAPSFDFLDKRSPGRQQRTYLNNIPLTVINKLKYLIETLKNLFVLAARISQIEKENENLPYLMMCPTISRMHFKYQERFILIPLIILMRDQSHYLLKYVSVQLESFSALTVIFSENQSTELSEQVLQYSQIDWHQYY